jgi:hypothetical protein
MSTTGTPDGSGIDLDQHLAVVETAASGARPAGNFEPFAATAPLGRLAVVAGRSSDQRSQQVRSVV